MRNLFKIRSLTILTIAVLFVGGFFVVTDQAWAATAYNGAVSGHLFSDINGDITGNVTGAIVGNISGRMTNVFMNHEAPFIGTITNVDNDVIGTINAMYHDMGVDTFSGEIINTGATEPVRIFGAFSKVAEDGYFEGGVITSTEPLVLVNEIIIKGGDNDVSVVTDGKNLTMMTEISPTNSAIQDIFWSVWWNENDSNHGEALINENTGLLTGTKPGLITVIAKARDGSSVYATKEMTIIPDNIPPTATVVHTGDSTGGTITYTFSEAVQLMNGSKTEVIDPILPEHLGIYELNDYTTHVQLADDVVKIGTITSTNLSEDAKSIIIEYTGNLEGTVDMSYIVDAWGLNITDLAKNKMVADPGTQVFTVAKATPTATVTAHDEIAKTITYTFSETMQLTKNDGTPITEDIASKLAVYAVDGLDYTSTKVADVTIIKAEFSGNVWTLTYTGTLVDQDNTKYIVDAWGSKIVDLAGNKVLPTAAAMFTVTGVDTIKPVITLIGDESLSLFASEAYADTGATANDNVDGDITSKIITVNPVDTLKVGTYTVTYNVSDVAGNEAPEITRTVTVKMDPAKAETTLATTTVNGLPTGTIPTKTELSVSSSSVTALIDISAGTVVTGPTGWDGTIKSPMVINTIVNPVADSGTSLSNVNSIEVGFGDTHLTFNNPVKITFTGKKDSLVGWSQNGVFHNITNTCDYLINPTLTADSDCRINDGDDLVVWTNHFTTFTTYTQVTNPVVSSGGGGGGGVIASYCSSVTYGEWGNPINGFQYREVVSQSPSYCSLSVSQQLQRARAYVAPSETIIEPTVDPVVPTNPDKQVLGEKKYAEGTLIRFKGENRIYIIVNGDMQAIRTLEQLRQYAGQEILNVTREGGVTAVLGEKKYADGTLIRFKGENRIYVIVNGDMQAIRTLEQLRQYAGKEILNVTREGDSIEVQGQARYSNGALLRGGNNKVYRVVDGQLQHLRSLAELRKYAGQMINNVSDSLITDWK